ncbi:MAG TPA: nitronate monooxygenase [Candidatus Paceibacterota bacterium]
MRCQSFQGGLMNREIIQGGMGIYVSNPHLAKMTSTAGALGTVSGTGFERILPHLLQLGDIGGHYRRALAHFPFPEVSERLLAKYFVEGGKPLDQDFRRVPAFSMTPSRELIEFTVAASFCAVWLSKEGHDGPISVNYLEKLQIPHIFHLTGAMLAGVDYVTMGAGITLQIPGVLDAVTQGGVLNYRVSVEGGNSPTQTISFNPREFFGENFPRELKRPGFLPIVSTDALAGLMVHKLPAGSVQGFVVELPTAGGHNAPPRGREKVFDDKGQPVYGERDEVNFEKLKNLGIPFWIGGSFASPEGIAKARSLGAVGIQAGSIFALSEDSGLDPHYRREMRRLGYRGELIIHTDPTASPTNYPFKVPQLAGTQSDPVIYEARKRICDRSALTVPYALPNGKVGLRCSSEPVADYVRKGGKIEDTVGRRCLCNVLFSAVGIGNPNEPPMFTLGDDASFLSHLMKDEDDSYTAVDAIRYLLSQK